MPLVEAEHRLEAVAAGPVVAEALGVETGSPLFLMAPRVRRPSSAQPPGGLQWYVVKVHSGREEAVKEVLERRARLESLEDVVGRILIPVERVVEIRNGRRAERTRKLFSGPCCVSSCSTTGDWPCSVRSRASATSSAAGPPRCR
jgi:hypothetical protein